MTESPTAPPPKVIFLDDDPHFLQGLRRALHALRQSWSMEFHDRPEQALRSLQGCDQAVIVTDWMMQEMDGLAICNQVRRDAADKPDLGRYVILLTGRQSAADHVTALDSGADDFIPKPFDPDVLLARIRVGQRMLALQANLRQANRQLLEMATTDPLTGALNRRQGMNLLQSELERVRRGLEDLSLFLLDLDKFKTINDTHGHIAGDAVLCTVVDTLRTSCRRYDSVVRWGGDELMVICPSADADQCRDIGRRLRVAIAGLLIQLDHETRLSITTSLGSVTLPKGSHCDATHLIALADGALYSVKAQGGDGLASAPWTEPAETSDEAPAAAPQSSF